jgi:preprotein translocase subunit SecD
VNRATRWRAIGVALLVVWMAWFGAGNFAGFEGAPSWLSDSSVRLGLDLRGGLHWVLSPDFGAAIDRELDTYAAAFADEPEARFEVASKNVSEGVLRIELTRLSDVDALREAAADAGALEEVSQDGDTLRFRLDAAAETDVRDRAMSQVLEVLRRRIGDPIQGVQESVVTKQGRDRVLVQIPGGQLDRAEARELINRTGFLTFRIAIDQEDNAELLEAKYPRVRAYLLPQIADLSGVHLVNARSRLDNRFGWVIDFTFDSRGARLFGDLTEKNVDRSMAIVLDRQVYSAPTINQRIGGGQGFIHGRFTPESAGRLAVILRAGSLPIPVSIAEERTVGPALGADSIRRGVRASIFGLALVVFFVAFYYRFSGLYASLALLTNLVLILGVMSMASATLTLPGIAGLVLTVGMAVDANVIIFERIREELRLGKTPRASIRTGFSKALWTILDANITTLITALVLYQYGTGPIKGFAVTLSIGIATSVFSALVITRLFFEFYPGNRPVESLSI